MSVLRSKSDAPSDRRISSQMSVEVEPINRELKKLKWHRSTFHNAFILGISNLLAPGIWGAMNSLGGGGEEKPYLVNAANALTFCLMVASCYVSPIFVRLVGIKGALIFGTLGYAPYAAGLYTNNRYGSEWFVLLGAALCGISAGVFWMAEAAIALAYPEPYNQGRFLGLWLSFRVAGNVLGGAINLGINANRSGAGKVSYNVYLVFIALQAIGPLAALLLTPPGQVERSDGVPVSLAITGSALHEFRAMARLFSGRNFLLLVPFIAQSVYTEAVMFSFEALWLSVRARALGSFLSGILAMGAGNLLGIWLDHTRMTLMTRARAAYATLMLLQGVCWIWATVLVVRYRRERPIYDWLDDGFARTFALFLSWIAGFQLCYIYLYFLISELATTEAEVIRIAGLLRGTESAVQAISYGLNSIHFFADVGGVYINFALWAIAIIPAWLVVRRVGIPGVNGLGDRKAFRERGGIAEGVLVEVER